MCGWVSTLVPLRNLEHRAEKKFAARASRRVEKWFQASFCWSGKKGQIGWAKPVNAGPFSAKKRTTQRKQLNKVQKAKMAAQKGDKKG